MAGCQNPPEWLMIQNVVLLVVKYRDDFSVQVLRKIIIKYCKIHPGNNYILTSYFLKMMLNRSGSSSWSSWESRVWGRPALSQGFFHQYPLLSHQMLSFQVYVRQLWQYLPSYHRHRFSLQNHVPWGDLNHAEFANYLHMLKICTLECFINDTL